MMKSTGIVRRVDELGRVVLPIELRRTLDIQEKDALEIYVDANSIILKKYEPSCVSAECQRWIQHKQNICLDCIYDLNK